MTQPGFNPTLGIHRSINYNHHCDHSQKICESIVELSCEQNKMKVKTQCNDTLFYSYDIKKHNLVSWLSARITDKSSG